MFQEDYKPFAYEIYLDPENNHKNRIIRTKSNTLFKLIRALKIPYIVFATLAVIILVGSVLLISFGTAGFFKAKPVSSYWSSNIAVNIVVRFHIFQRLCYGKKKIFLSKTFFGEMR